MLYMVAYGVHAWTDLTCYLLSMVVLVMAPVRLNLNLRETFEQSTGSTYTGISFPGRTGEHTDLRDNQLRHINVSGCAAGLCKNVHIMYVV